MKSQEISSKNLWQCFKYVYASSMARRFEKRNKQACLGLCMSKHIVDAHGSTIYVENQEGEREEWSSTLSR